MIETQDEGPLAIADAVSRHVKPAQMTAGLTLFLAAGQSVSHASSTASYKFPAAAAQSLDGSAAQFLEGFLLGCTLHGGGSA